MCGEAHWAILKPVHVIGHSYVLHVISCLVVSLHTCKVSAAAFSRNASNPPASEERLM